MSEIERIIGDIEEYIDNCRPAPFSSNKIIVEKEQIDELLRELRMKTPDEIKKYQKLISNKDAIIADAKSKADEIVKTAQIQNAELVSEHEIMQRAYAEAATIQEQAYAQAQQILDEATEEANSVKYGAIAYTDEMLANLQRIIEHSIESSRMKYEGLLAAFDKDLNVVISNRAELAGGANTDASEESEDYDDDGLQFESIEE